MAEKRFVKNTVIILVISALLTLFIFIFVEHHRDTPNRVQRERNKLLSGGSSAAEQSVAERMKPIGQVHVATTKTQRASITVAAASVKANGQQVYQSACIACHGGGIAGAPKLGDARQWAKRIARGQKTLYASAINGMRGSAGVMPPKGGNLALSNAEVRAAVDYMVRQSK